MAALVRASLLNLVDATIREQECLPQAQRWGALVVVDEMQAIPGVGFKSMLSELGKDGATFLLATQSLAKLEALSPTMRDTPLANVGCLAVFQVSGRDARELAWELGRERISEDDIAGRPVPHCYVRASVVTERLPAFSMTVRGTEFGDPERAAPVRREAAAYLPSAEDIAAQQAERQKRINRLTAQAEGAQEPAATPLEAPPKEKGKRPRSRRPKPPA